MTNEEAKQEAIKKAWRDYDYFKKDIDENGVYHFTDRNLVVSKLEYIKESDGYRPYSLAGIENNNGWIRIEPDGSNLPYHPTKSYRTGYIVDFGFSRDNGQCSAKMVQDRFERKRITHFRVVTIEPDPVY